MPILALTSTYSVAVDNSTCIATIVNDTCDINVASVQYPVIVENQTITLDLDKYPSIGEFEPYAGDLLNASRGDPAGPLGGLEWSFNFRWWTFNELFQFRDPATNSTIYLTRMGSPVISHQYAFYNKEDSTNAYSCVVTFNRPTDDIVKSIPQIMFRAGLNFAAANDTRPIPMVQTTPTLVYQSDYSWFAIAIAVTAIATFGCVIPLWGWWDLGRKATLNPIETAKAFNIPRLRTAGHGCGAKDIVKDVGNLRVGYIQVQLQDATGNSVPSMELRPLETPANMVEC